MRSSASSFIKTSSLMLTSRTSSSAKASPKNTNNSHQHGQSRLFSSLQTHQSIQPHQSLSSLLNTQSSLINQSRSITRSGDDDYKGVSLHHVKYYLKNKSLAFSESHPCLKLSVPSYVFGEQFSAEWSKVSDNITTVFINKVTGSWVSPDLGVFGSWSQLETILTAWTQSKKSAKNLPSQPPTMSRLRMKLPESVKTMLDSSNSIDQLTMLKFKKLLSNFKLRQSDFSRDHFTKFEGKCNEELTEMYFPIRYVTGDIVGVKVLRVVDNCLEETNIPDIPANGVNILPFFHNLEQAWSDVSTSDCVLVGSILDSVVISARSSKHVICLPDWTKLSPDLLPFLDQFTNIIIWLGAGVQGVETARNFAKKIGDKQCRVVTNEYPSALQAVRSKMDVSEILETAARQHHQYITSFESLRHDVFLEFLQADQMQGVKWTRFDGLNNTMRGFRRGEMTVITGRTGSGKTTFMSEYSLDLCQQGISTLWGSFEVQNVRLVRMMLKQFSLIDLDDKIQEFDAVAERFSHLPMYFTTFHGTNEVEKVLDAMAHAVYVHDIAHVIIDNIQFMIGSGSGGVDRFTRQDQCIEMFRKFATLHNVHVSLVIHPRKDNDERLTIHSIFGGGKATQEADNVILLQTEEDEDTVVKKKYIEIVKNRFSGDLGRIPLFFSKNVLCLSSKVAGISKREAQAKKLNTRKRETKSTATTESFS